MNRLRIPIILAGFASIAGFISLRMVYPPASLMCAEPHFSFGEVDPGESLSHTFVIKNTGGRNLIISGIHSSCTCTSADIVKSTIIPGETSELIVRMRVPEKATRTTVHIALASNDPGSPVTKLSIDANPSPLLEVSPPSLDLGTLKFGSVANSTGKLTILCRDPGKLKVEALPWSSPLYVEHELDSGGDRPRLQVEMRDTTPIGPIMDSIQISISMDKTIDPIKLSVRGEVKGPYGAIPPILNLGLISNKGKISDQVNIVADDNQPFTLQVESISPSLTPFLTALPADRTGILNYEVSSSKNDTKQTVGSKTKLTKNIRGYIHLKCVGKREYPLNVPVSFFLD